MNLLCQSCGDEFPARRDDAKYCSGRCRVRAHRRNANVTDDQVHADMLNSVTQVFTAEFIASMHPKFREAGADRFKRIVAMLEDQPSSRSDAPPDSE